MLTASAVLAAVAYLGFEIALRVVQGGCYSYLPYRLNGSFPTLPPAASFCAVNSERARIAYVTDREGARRASQAQARLPCEHCVMTIGDSQAFGYGLAYESTFTAIYAARTRRQSTIVAASADDPDYERLAAAQYVAATHVTPESVFVVINFGNDLDELFLGRRTIDTRGAGASSWLPEHSFVYADLALAGRILMRKLVHTSLLPPGTNPVVYALTPSDFPVVEAELARDTVEIVRETHARTAVAILIPPDYAVSASEFTKYKSYYTAAEYALWRSRLPHMTAVMTSVEDGLARQLVARGVRVLDTRNILASIAPERAFDRFSHHLTPLANRLIANELK
jgi:hypothetical protein